MEGAGFLSGYNATLVHDCWTSYWAFPVKQHALCLAHILRELQGILDDDAKQEWAKWFMALLRDVKSIKEKLIASGKGWASRYYKSKFHRQWRAFIY